MEDGFTGGGFKIGSLFGSGFGSGLGGNNFGGSFGGGFGGGGLSNFNGFGGFEIEFEEIGVNGVNIEGDLL